MSLIQRKNGISRALETWCWLISWESLMNRKWIHWSLACC
nr:MAG TPA_asm: hypothetical protein [Caudoviricetes sp.]